MDQWIAQALQNLVSLEEALHLGVGMSSFLLRSGTNSMIGHDDS
jgi:hypothetical protein